MIENINNKLFCVLRVILLIVVALLTQPDSKSFPTLKEALAAANTKTKEIWAMWFGLAVIMLVLYLIFN